MAIANKDPAIIEVSLHRIVEDDDSLQPVGLCTLNILVALDDKPKLVLSLYRKKSICMSLKFMDQPHHRSTYKKSMKAI